MNFRSIVIFLAIVAIFIGFGCSSKTNPVDPAIENQTGSIANAVPSENNHHLLAFNYIYVDTSNSNDIRYEIVPARDAEKHWNILKFLEVSPCAICFKIKGITPSGTGTYFVSIQVESPFPNPKLTGFDVRGIAMFNASHNFPASSLTVSDQALGDGEVVNPDGFTTLYNSATQGSGPAGLEGYFKGKYATLIPPDGLVNLYKRFVTDNPLNTRNAFYSGDSITVTYEVKFPTSGLIFGYALDASYTPPTNTPVTDPMTDFPPEANCSEPYRLDVSNTSINPIADSKVTIRVYDWQGKTSFAPPVLECPDLFDGTMTATFDSDGAGYTEYSATVSNAKSALDGSYKCLISVEDNDNDPVLKP
ncbi:MAG: hypothetical protein ABIC40_06435, partial [bacterium]